MPMLRQAWSRLGRQGLPAGSPQAYAFALACVAAAAAAHFAFAQFARGITPSILYNPAVFVATLLGGIRAGLLGVAASVALLWWLFDWRSFEPQATAFTPALNCALFVAAALVIVWVAAGYRSLTLHGPEQAGASGAPLLRNIAGRLNRVLANPLAGYAGAVICVALATLARAGFARLGGETLPLVSYYPAVLLSALMGGTGAGLLAIGLSLCVVWSDFPGPLLSFEPPTRDESVSLSLYVFVCLLTVWVAEHRRHGAEHGRAPPSRLLQWATSVVVAASAVLLTTFVLLSIGPHLPPELLVLGYLLPTIIIAMHYGSTVAVCTAFISGIAAAFFLFAPKFSFYIVDPLNIAELGFFLVLAITASKAVAPPSQDDMRGGSHAGDAGV